MLKYERVECVKSLLLFHTIPTNLSVKELFIRRFYGGHYLCQPMALVETLKP